MRYRIAGGEENLVKERVAKVTLVQPDAPLEDVRDLARHVIYDLRSRRGLHASAAIQHQAAAAASGQRGAVPRHSDHDLCRRSRVEGLDLLRGLATTPRPRRGPDKWPRATVSRDKGSSLPELHAPRGLPLTEPAHCERPK